MNEGYEPFDPFVPDELIVDSEHATLVLDVLADLGISSLSQTENAMLGLTLLSELIVTQHDAVEALTDLDGALAEVRHRLRGSYGGWAPEMGKQRVAVSGPAGPKPMALGLPVATTDPIVSHALSADAGHGVVIGMIDTPVFPHAQLDHKYLEATPPGPNDESGHGTFVAGIIQSYAPQASIIARGLFTGAKRTARIWDLAVALVDLADHVQILNLSWVVHTFDGEAPLAIARAIERIPSGVVVVAAAGNHGRGPAEPDTYHDGASSHSPSWPAALPGMVAVGADADFSPKLPWVDCLAPGDDVVGLYPDHPVAGGTYDGQARWSGTSFSCAAVAGAIAARMTSVNETATEALDWLLGNPGQVVTPFVLGS
jgi:membrane-anchored mycosin MYCP